MAKKVAKNEEIESESEKKIDTKKIIKEIDKHVEDKKNELTQDISDKIEEQITFLVNKKMKEEEKRIVRGKNGKIFRRNIVIILLVALVGYFAYCLYDVDYFHIRTKEVIKETSKEENNDKNNNDKKPVTEEHDAKYYISNYRYLIEELQINDQEIINLYTKNVTRKNISNDLKLKIAYYNLDKTLKEKDDKNMIMVNPKDLLESLKKVFGDEVSITDEMFTYNNIRLMYYGGIYLGFYEKETDNNLVYQIYNAKELNNKLIFEVALGKLENETLTNLNGTVVEEKYNEKNITEHLDKLTKVQITFEKVNEKYIFESTNNI